MVIFRHEVSMKLHGKASKEDAMLFQRYVSNHFPTQGLPVPLVLTLIVVITILGNLVRAHF
jgi:hypothetical protein